MIIEDEDLVRDLLTENIRQIPFIELVAVCRTAAEAIETLRERSIDLLLLDVRLPGMSGLQFLQSLGAPPSVILVTAYQDYAVRAFELNVVDYVLKPFSFERILRACHKAYRMMRIGGEGKAPPVSTLRYFFVNSEYALVKVNIDEIRYVEGMKDYIKIFLSTAERPVITRMTLKTIQAKLPQAEFVRTHKSFIASLSRITSIKRDSVCIGTKEIPLSESLKEEVLRAVRHT